LKGGLRNPIGKGAGYMTVFEALSLMVQAGIFLVSLLIYIETKSKK
jgi:hypothetical protein